MADDKRGLASADQETRERVAREGGEARRDQGADYHELGQQGGEARKNEGTDYSKLGKKGGEARRDQGTNYEDLGRMGGSAPHSGKGQRDEGDA